MNKNQIQEIINSLVADIEDRRGLGDEWNYIDDSVQQEIKDEWFKIIEAINKVFNVQGE